MFPFFFFFFSSDNIYDIDHTSDREELSLYICIINLRTSNVKLRGIIERSCEIVKCPPCSNYNIYIYIYKLKIWYYDLYSVLVYS